VSHLEAQKFNHWPVKGTKGGVSCVAWGKRYQSAKTFARGVMWQFVCFEDHHMKTSIQKPATVMSDEPL
jgi:hypothetical protein